MNNQTPKPKQKKKPLTPHRRLLLIVLVICGIMLFSVVISVVYEIAVNGDYYSAFYSGGSGYEPLDILFAPADYESDIFEDETYMKMNRDIKYIDGAQSTEVALDEDGSYFGTGLVFFQNYFNCVIRGDYETYRTFISDDYDTKNAYPIPGMFTMQKIHSISVEHRGDADKIVSQNEVRRYYVVKYQIYQNNGTFRDDIRPTDVLPLLFELTTVGEETKITKIVKFPGA
ncbi:MAG: hypothetical protein IJW77_17615 [Clostridia bacterium]|nr:hypothetical protein [Clostridia bacterium]